MTAMAITPNLSVSEPVLPHPMLALAGAGFRAINCNRPDGEGADPPAFAEIEAEARAAGLTAAYRTGGLNAIKIDFCNAGAVLLGVREHVPTLMQDIGKDRANLHFQHHPTRVDGPAKTAWSGWTNACGTTGTGETGFDLIHVVPPQIAPGFVRVSALVDAAGWVDVANGWPSRNL